MGSNLEKVKGENRELNNRLFHLGEQFQKKVETLSACLTEAAKEIKKDPYSHGLANGLLFARSLMNNEPPELLTVDKYESNSGLVDSKGKPLHELKIIGGKDEQG